MRAGLRQQPSRCYHRVFYTHPHGARLLRRTIGLRRSSTSTSTVSHRPRRTTTAASSTPKRAPARSAALHPPGPLSLHPSARIAKPVRSRHGSESIVSSAPAGVYFGSERARIEKVPVGWQRNAVSEVKVSRAVDKLYFPDHAGDEFARVSLESILPCEAAVSNKTGYSQIASFNWVKGYSDLTARAIYVPGGPALYRPQKTPYQLCRLPPPIRLYADRDRTPNNWKIVFQAIEFMTPDFDFGHVDIVIPSLRFKEFLHFCKGIDNGRNISVHVVLINNTLFIDGHKPARMVNGEAIYGRYRQGTRGNNSNGMFGLDFERSFSQWPRGMEDSGSHHRVIEYKVGPLNCMVVSGVDACLEWPEESHKFSGKKHSSVITGQGAGTCIPRGFRTNSPAAEMKAFQPNSSLSISRYLKEQMWITRAKYAILGCYRMEMGGEKATLKQVVVGDMTDHCISWEEEEANQLALRKLVTLIRHIRDLLQSTGRDRCYITRGIETDSPLQIFDSECDMPLSEVQVSRFWRTN